MHSLGDWIIRLTDEDIGEINRTYSSGNYGTVEKEIESLPDIEPMKYGTSLVDANLLEKLHLKIRNQRCETEIWDAIVFHISGPLPMHIAHDLIDRDIVVTQLGHTRQNDEIQWRLASLVDEALLTLFRDLYTNPDSKVEELQKLLTQHSDHGWLLDKWEYWADESSSPDKEIVFHRWVWKHPSRPADFPNPDDYLGIMADRERQKIEERLQAEHEAKQKQLRIEREAELRRLELERVSTDKLDQMEIEFILLSQEPDMLLALASNSQIEIQWVQKLINCHHVKGARQIREAADRNIEARQQ